MEELRKHADIIHRRDRDLWRTLRHQDDLPLVLLAAFRWPDVPRLRISWIRAGVFGLPLQLVS